MRRSPDPRPLVLAILVGLVVGLATCAGCKSPDATFVSSSRKLYDVIAPDYRRYVTGDQQLDADQKARRIRAADSWDLLIRKGEGR